MTGRRETEARLKGGQRTSLAQPDHSKCRIAGVVPRIWIEKRRCEDELLLLAFAMLIAYLRHAAPKIA